VRANPSKVVAAISEHSEAGSAPYGLENMNRENIDSRLYKADCGSEGHLLGYYGTD
jgi:hypothetical protein